LQDEGRARGATCIRSFDQSLFVAITALPVSLRSCDPCGDDLPKMGVGLEDACFPCRFALDSGSL